MDDARKGRFDTILVWRFDRFGRSLIHLVQSLEEFQAMNIDFISYSESIDTSSPVGKCMFSVIGAFANMERDLIRERVLAGIKRARSEGKRFGRPEVPCDIQDVVEARKQGKSVREIAEELHKSPSKIARLLKSVSKVVPEKQLESADSVKN
jgi:DNA invertase Pin-like site-specific DNA recombinase